MKGTQWLQQTRIMRFEEAFWGWSEQRLTQQEAARLLGMHERTFRRHINRYQEQGLDRFLDKRLTQVSRRRAPVDEVLGVHCLYPYYRLYSLHLMWFKRDGHLDKSILSESEVSYDGSRGIAYVNAGYL